MATKHRNSGSELVLTGVPGVDTLLYGGVAPGACMLIEGQPGAGKTTFGLQFLHAGATRFDEPGVIITFEEFPEEIYRDAEAYGWDFRALEEQGTVRVICTTPEVFGEDALTPQGMLETVVDEIGAKRILIDSITQMAHVTDDPLELRRTVYGLRNCFKRLRLAAVMTRELETDDETLHFEEYLVDVVVRLGYRLIRDSGDRVRELEITKTRARPHVSGRHLMRITDSGLHVVPSPHALEEFLPEVAGTPLEFMPTGSVGLDAMLRGGIVKGSTTIVAGSTGVGKTVLGLQFLCAGANQGEQGLYISFEQSHGELARLAQSLGLPTDQCGEGGMCAIKNIRPGRKALGIIVADVIAAIEELRPHRVVIDALSTLAKAPGGAVQGRGELAALVSYMRSMDTTALICDETSGIVGQFEVSGGVMVSSLADNIILMRYVELASEMRRALLILKARCIDHDKEIREYVIGQGGIELRDKFAVSTGLLSGRPLRSPDDFF